MCANCSIRRMPAPEAAIAWSAGARRFTTTGASPSDSSSTRITRGCETSACASTTICCSPPESEPAGDLPALLELGEELERARDPAAASFLSSAYVATRRFSSTVSPGSSRLPSGTIATPAPRMNSGRLRVRSASPSRTRPLSPQHAAHGEHERRLAGAVRAEQRRHLARRDRERDVVQHAASAACDAEILEPQLRAGGASRRSQDASEPSQSRRPRCPGRRASRSRRGARRLSARCDQLAEVEHRRGRAAGRDEAHVVVDEDHERAELLRDLLITPPRCSVSSSGRPAAGSSRSTIRGAADDGTRDLDQAPVARAEPPDLRPSGASRGRRSRSRSARRLGATRAARPSARGSSRRCRTWTAARSPAPSGTCVAGPSARGGSRPS